MPSNPGYADCQLCCQDERKTSRSLLKIQKTTFWQEVLPLKRTITVMTCNKC
jgi:hypothetical protein